MRILLGGPLLSKNGEFSLHNAEVGIYEALLKLGHEVVAWDYRNQLLLFPNKDKILKSTFFDDQELFIDKDFDFVLFPGPGITEKISKSKAWKSIKHNKKVVWCSEPIRLQNYKDRMSVNKKNFDIFFTFDESEIPLYKNIKIKAKFLPQAFNPNWYRPLNLPKSQKFPKVLCFVGSVGGKWSNRTYFLNLLIQSGFRIHVATLFDAHKVNRAYNMHDGVLNLGLYCEESGPQQDLKAFGLQQRIFETIGAGQIPITNEIPIDSNKIFKNYENILCYNKDNIKEICNLVLNKKSSNELKENILKIREQHTYETRMKQLIDLI